MSTLVVVESPAKAKTIKNYLGKGYEVMATLGHIRDLPRSSMGVNIKKQFQPMYLTVDGKEKIIKQLKDTAKESDKVLLATDPDREGEAISWHLAYLLGLDINNSNRIVFEEITKAGVQKGMNNPRQIDMDLVNAQQARRVLDRIVGYMLSPFLWKKVKRGLSAGRVQSVTVRLIVDREREIEAFIPNEYWYIDVILNTEDSKQDFKARLRTINGIAADEFKIENKKDCDVIVEDLMKQNFNISSVKERSRKRAPEPPFITSTLQQDASRKLGFTARRTMRAAQELYEGVAVEGHDTLGLITYMGTDSTRISPEAHTEAIEYIEKEYGSKYAEKEARAFRTRRVVAAQEGHEAIRPTLVEITPDIARKTLSEDQAKLYKLIWERFIASRMTDQVIKTITVDIAAGKYELRATGSEVIFDGFTKLYEESTDETKEANNMLPPMTKDTKLIYIGIEPSQHFTQPPPRFNEASLIKALEENGIGRPSTYAPTISTVIDRGYIERQQKALVPTSLGFIVTDLMKEQFERIVDVGFSADMEKNLDRIEEGKENWISVLDEFYGPFEQSLKTAEKNMEGKTIEVPEIVSDVVCEFCGKQMVVKTGRYGKFLACPGYPECKNIKQYYEKSLGVCPKCGKNIVLRRTAKNRIFYACETGKECGFMTWNLPTDEKCTLCGSTLFKKTGKKPQLQCLKEGCGFTKEIEK